MCIERKSSARLLLAATLLLGAPGLAQSTTRPGPAAFVEHLRLELGEQRVLSSEGVRSYSEGTPGVVDVRLTSDGRQFVLVALAPGSTTLLLLLHDGSERQYRIEVPTADGEAPPPAAPDPFAVPAKDNVRLDFYFVKLDRSYGHQLGVAWPARFGGGTLNASYDLLLGGYSNATAVVEQALPGLDLAQAAGFAKLARHAALITANGEKARFGGGGEVNVLVQGSLTTGVHRIAFGSTISVLPRYDRDSARLELEIEADVSDLSDDRGTGTPGRITSTLSTRVNLELGQSLMLAGLSASSQARSRGGLPGLSQIPILGALFGSERELSQDSEDVVFIVPSVLDAVALDARKRVRAALDAYERFGGGTPAPLVGREPPGAPLQRPGEGGAP